jgi:endo-1,4-beta-xylanase
MTEEFSRRKFLQGAGAGACVLSAASRWSASGERMSLPALDPASTPLKSLAERRGLLYGTAVTQHKLADQAYADIVIQQCDLVVPELALKWEALRPTPTTYDFSGADWTLQFSQENRMKLRGHTLVWHLALPKWFNSYATSQNAKQLMLSHITTVVSRYAGKMHSWDVINEAMQPSDKRSDGLRIVPWLELVGPDYIEMAFRAAAEADPRAILVWNENWLEEDTAGAEHKRALFLQNLKTLRSRNVPIHAIGLQSHLKADRPNLGGPQFNQFLDQVSDLGLKVLVTELDVVDASLPNDIGARDQAIADVYFNYLKIVLAQKSVIAVLNWGLSDKYTWIASKNPRADSAPVRPLPFDANMQATPAWTAMARAFDSAPSR